MSGDRRPGRGIYRVGLKGWIWGRGRWSLGGFGEGLERGPVGDRAGRKELAKAGSLEA